MIEIGPNLRLVLIIGMLGALPILGFIVGETLRGWGRQKRPTPTTLDIPVSIWGDLKTEAEARGLDFSEMHRRVAWIGLHIHRQAREHEAKTILQYPNGHSERLLLDIRKKSDDTERLLAALKETMDPKEYEEFRRNLERNDVDPEVAVSSF